MHFLADSGVKNTDSDGFDMCNWVILELRVLLWEACMEGLNAAHGCSWPMERERRATNVDVQNFIVVLYFVGMCLVFCVLCFVFCVLCFVILIFLCSCMKYQIWPSTSRLHTVQVLVCVSHQITQIIE